MYYKLLKADINGMPVSQSITKSTLECDVLCSVAEEDCRAMRVVRLNDGSGKYICQLLTQWQPSGQHETSVQAAVKLCMFNSERY